MIALSALMNMKQIINKTFLIFEFILLNVFSFNIKIPDQGLDFTEDDGSYDAF